MMPTRPQRAYDGQEPPKPTFTPAQPTFTRGFAPPQFTGGYPPPTWQPVPPMQQPVPPRPRWSVQRKIMVWGTAVFAVAVVLTAIGASSSGSQQAPYVTQLQGDGYTVTQQGKLTGGEGIGYAEGTNATGSGELVVQTKSAADAQATANGLQGNSDGANVTTNGVLLIIQSNDYTVIQNAVTSNGW